jgi:hypothetical protein
MQIDVTQLTGVHLTAKQKRFLRSWTPNIALIGGFGSGKTLPFCLKAILLSLYNGDGYAGLMVSPTYQMFQRVLLPTLRDDILSKLGRNEETGKSLWDHCHYSPSKLSLELPWGGTIYFGSADNPNRLRGLNLAFVGVDEATTVRDFPELAISLTSRLRRARIDESTGRPLSQFFVCGTPEGLDEVYQKFETPPLDPEKRDEWKQTHELIRMATIDNPGVPQEFIEGLKTTLSEDQARAYIYGEHVDVGRGLAYYNFNRDHNVRDEAIYDPSEPLHISWDFNLSPMSCSINQCYGSGAHGVMVTVDEISLNKSNTKEVCKEFIRKYGREGLGHNQEIYIYGDASAVVGTSNYDEIEEWLRPAFTGRIVRRVPNRNPRHASRLKAANALLRNANGEVRWIIHPKCAMLIRDLESQGLEENLSKRKDQKSMDGGTLGHMSDTTDYLIDRVFPFKRLSVRSEEPTGMVDWMGK